MSDHQTSYYEIALTNRQVMTVFVILLLCVVAAFLSGVWFGRQGTPAPIELLAGAPDAALADDEPDGEEGIGELGFFTNGDEKTPAESGAQEAPAGAVKPPARRAERAPAPERQAQSGAASSDRPAPASAAPAGAQATTGLVIQVFSSNDRVQAEKVVADLRQGGFPARLAPVEVDRRTMFRVRVGPYPERAEAERVATRLRSEFKLDTWITQ